VLIADVLSIADETVILAMQVVLEGNGHHTHFLQFVKALKMGDCALGILQQVVLDPGGHI
jgi:Mg2+/citrate symporter